MKPKIDQLKKLTPQRTLEVADSLENESNEKKRFYSQQKTMANEAIKNGVGNKEIGQVNYKKIPTGYERLKLANEGLKSASNDSSNSARYKKLALKAMGKKP